MQVVRLNWRVLAVLAILLSFILMMVFVALHVSEIESTQRRQESPASSAPPTTAAADSNPNLDSFGHSLQTVGEGQGG